MPQNKLNILKDFIAFCKKELNIQTLPKISLIKDKAFVEQNRSYGEYNPETNAVRVFVTGRNLADICRSLAHELCHHRQNELDMIYDEAGNTGTDIENDANAMAGIIMRDYGKRNIDIYELGSLKKNNLRESLYEVQQLPINNSIIFGVKHHSKSDAQAVINYVKKRFSPEDKVVFMGEGGDDSNKYAAGSEQEMIYDELSSYFDNLVNDSWDGADLDVMNDQSTLYKIQKQKTGLSHNQILAANWASMVGQNILQDQSVADFAPEDYLSPEGIKFLKVSAQEAGLPLSDNLYEPTAEDYDTLYRLSFPEDHGDKHTKVSKAADAFNQVRDENLLRKLKQYESRGYKVVATAGEGHIDLIKAMLKK